jgi:hypothetical protein
MNPPMCAIYATPVASPAVVPHENLQGEEVEGKGAALSVAQTGVSLTCSSSNSNVPSGRTVTRAVAKSRA